MTAPGARRDAPRCEAGFAMPAALLIAVVALLFAGVAVAAALGALHITAGDGSHARARSAAKAGLELGLHRVAWKLVGQDSTCSCVVDVPSSGAAGPEPPGPGATEAAASEAEVSLESVDAIGLGWPSTTRLVRATSQARVGGAAASVAALVALRPSAVPRGLSVAEDAELATDVVLTGCGAYVGGVLRGREHVSFSGSESGDPAPDPSVPAPSPPDHAWGGRWPVAGVHAGGGIWAAGIDTATLDPRPEAYAGDTVGVEVGDLVQLPDAAWRATARAHALDPGDALAGGLLHLDRLPAALPTGEPGTADAAGRADLLAGYLVFVPARALAGGVVITGVRDPSWCPVTVVIDGNAVLGADPGAGGTPPAPIPGAPGVALRGAVVVTGSLSVASVTTVRGHIACRRLTVLAPLSLSLESTWRESPPVGFVEPVLLARS